MLNMRKVSKPEQSVYINRFETSQHKKFSNFGNKIALSLVLFSVLYNCLLAALASSGVPMGYSTVAAVEIIIIISCLALCLSSGLSQKDLIPISLVWFIAVISVIVSIKYETFYITGVRNFFIIAIFSMLGQRMDQVFVRRLFFIASTVTLLVLIWEMVSVESYARFFYPAHYFAVTRGSEISEFDESGLSAGTVTFSGRFSLGVFSGRRTSSIFLEQVGINAYAIVCMVFLNGFWAKLSVKERLLQIATIALIVLSNNARMAALMCVIMPIGFFIFPRLNKFLIIGIPFAVVSVMFILSPIIKDAQGDDLIGRLAITYRLLNILDAQDLIFGNPALANKSFDSGYTFILTSVGFFGAMAYLFYFIVYPRFDTPEQRRGAWSAAIYVLLWLIVGGTGSFSIKTAALLWVFIGCLSSVDNRSMVSPLWSGRGAGAASLDRELRRST